LKHIIEAYLNAAIYYSNNPGDANEISNSFSETDLRNINILTIARFVQQTILLNYFECFQYSSEREQNKRDFVKFMDTVGKLILAIENHAEGMRNHQKIVNKNNNYLVDKLKS